MNARETSPSPIPLIPPSLDSTYGAFLLGLFIGLMLYGLFLHQTYFYMRTYVRDSLSFKLYVIVLLLIDTVHSMNLMIICYDGLVSNYFFPLRLLKSSWGFNILSIVTGMEVILCQGFFAYRVCMAYQRWKTHIALVVASVLLSELGFCIASTVKGFQSATWFAFEQDTWMIAAVLCIALVLDSTLTVILTTFLWRKRAGFVKTNSKLDTLIAYAMCTGLLTDILNILGFAFAQTSPGNMWYVAMIMEVAKVYSNSVLAALNFRDPETTSESMTDYYNPNSLTLPVAIELTHVPRMYHHANPVSDHAVESSDVIDITVDKAAKTLDEARSSGVPGS
ncbi:hypothetical protein L226DRAFT_563068 [Lentinus tigrinus ALCF2SS1-7]|uniref:uncharacterized protein n=1 Tax=Lentinus tigrinus ALCF2SS1-7 TaxID=1328758 RepID=UPI0011663DC6|nr:hypothetical protein L226DRAFT_563068 [Lentinus tigrinus ALCF2SS1-7]